MRDKLRSLDADTYMSYTINLNSKHDGPSLQTVLEAPLEKKAGERFVAGLVHLTISMSIHELTMPLPFCPVFAPKFRRHALWPTWQQEAHLLCACLADAPAGLPKRTACSAQFVLVYYLSCRSGSCHLQPRLPTGLILQFYQQVPHTTCRLTT